MHTHSPQTLRRSASALAVLGGLLLSTGSPAFPPAPHHTLYGIVRNALGDPMDTEGATVLVRTADGTELRTSVAATFEPGVNYRLRVPMDTAITADRYTPAALRRHQAFQMRVRIGSTVYLPLEMVLAAPSLGQPAGTTRLDLTLGEDVDGDGLPDAWERAIANALGLSLDEVTPDGDADGDGLTNLQEYQAGTYAFDPKEGFALSMVGIQGQGTVLEFLAMRGRTYAVEASTDLRTWTPVTFGVVEGGAVGATRTSYAATSVSLLRVSVPPTTDDAEATEPYRYFRALVR